MDFTSTWFPAWFNWLSNTISLVLVLLVLMHTFQQGFPRFNQWLWSIFFLSLVWFMRASMESGINIHLSGAMLMTLMFGWRMGFLGMCMVNVATGYFNDALFINLGVSILLNALLPVTLSYFIFLLLEAKLPRHFFIYIYGSAFFGSWVMSAVTGFVIAMVLAVFGVFELSMLVDNYLPFHFLLGFSEAFLTAGLITVFVVYRPSWVFSFRDKRYLEGK